MAVAQMSVYKDGEQFSHRFLTQLSGDDDQLWKKIKFHAPSYILHES